MSDQQFLDDPYNPQTQPYMSETLPMDEIFRRAFDGLMLDIHTSMPAQVTRVRNNGFVDLQPLLKRTYNDGSQVELPVVQMCMVLCPSGADWWLKGPIEVGDTGVILFSERSLDIWMVSGGMIDPQDARHHDLSDGFFIPGIRPSSTVIPGNASDLDLKNGEAEISMQKTGRFLIKNDSYELFDLLTQTLAKVITTLDQLVAARTNTQFGPMPLNNFAQFQTLSTDVAAIKTNLETLKGA